MEATMAEWLKLGMVQRSNSTYNSPSFAFRRNRVKDFKFGNEEVSYLGRHQTLERQTPSHSRLSRAKQHQNHSVIYRTLQLRLDSYPELLDA